MAPERQTDRGNAFARRRPAALCLRLRWDILPVPMTALILLLAVAAFVLSFGFTLAMKHVVPRVGFVDKPGHRKIHHAPKPLGGGVAIFLAVALPLLAAVLVVPGLPPHPDSAMARSTPARAYVADLQKEVRQQTPLALTFLGATLLLHIVGLVDDRTALGPYTKLVAQLAAAGVLVVGR